MGAAAPKPPLAIPPHSKLWGILADLVKRDDLFESRLTLYAHALISLTR